MTEAIFRVHPAINIARVGNSSEYYIAPETAAGEVVDEATGLFGGLPTRPGTENTPITAEDFRDAQGNVKRQAARFKIFAYDQSQNSYPSEDPGREVTIGDIVAGKKIKDIIWMVHLANKKNNNYKISREVTNEQGEKVFQEGILPYENGKTPPLRNATYGDDLDNEGRRRKLVIDAGPRTITSSTAATQQVHFNAATQASYIGNDGQSQTVTHYPVSFPGDHFTNQNAQKGTIETLGELQIEPGTGRLIVTGGYGNTFSFKTAKDKAPTLDHAIDNDGWFDDVSDGPINATVIFEDGSTVDVVGGWFVCTDPSYAPQTRNVVSTWDDMFNTWVEQLDLIPALYKEGEYQDDYPASFYADVLPVFHGAFLQRWNTNLPGKGISGHNWVANIKPADNPQAKIPNFEALIRNPNIEAENSQGKKMPLALGDAQKSFLSLSSTQYFLMQQWYKGNSNAYGPALGEGERLDQVVLHNCLGGRYSPGIDLTFIVRDVNLYKQDWRGVTGPFRINQRQLDYAMATDAHPFLQQGYIPLRTTAVEPGDLSKFMSQPWHTDYNSCAVHEPSPNPPGNNTLYWSWPAQRPVQVHPVGLCTYDEANNIWNLGGQLFSVRGDGEGKDNQTHTNLPQDEGRYQSYQDFLDNWHKTGFVIQGTQIADEYGGNYGKDKFLEVASLYTGQGDIVQPWPTAVIPTPEKSDD
ncbi:MAG: LodA/GoxA family CTQ-dependent oxidase [Marinobacterium sp.]|nr:LodA/GoxA family CTQ-dependent oxidase [Marinobacterium sp.]